MPAVPMFRFQNRTSGLRTKGPVADFVQEAIPTLEKHLNSAESLTGERRSRR